MKFQISSGKLVKALNIVSKAIPTRATLPILETVLLDVSGNILKITGTDLELSIATEIKVTVFKEGSVCVSFQKFFASLKLLPDVPIVFEFKKGRLTFRTDNGNYVLNGEDGQEFPIMETVANGKNLPISTHDLQYIIAQTGFAISNDDLRPAMCGLYVQAGVGVSRFVATDGHRLACVESDGITSDSEYSFIIPSKAIDIAGKIFSGDQLTVIASDNHISIADKTTTLTSRLINEKYPSYESVIPQNDKILTVDREQILAAVKRVSVFSNNSTRQIILDISRDAIMVIAEDVDMASCAREAVTCSNNNEDNFVIGFNSNYLTDILKILDTEHINIEFSEPNRAVIIRPGGDHHVMMLLMPVLIADYELA